MNLSSIVSEQPKTPEAIEESLRLREQKLIRIVEAVREIRESNAWSSLKTEVLDHLVGSLTRDLQEEARKPSPDTNRLNRLTGQLEWAEKYSDLSRMEEVSMMELKGIKMRLYGNPES